MKKVISLLFYPIGDPTVSLIIMVENHYCLEQKSVSHLHGEPPLRMLKSGKFREGRDIISTESKSKQPKIWRIMII